jgi:hypothetical protein
MIKLIKPATYKGDILEAGAIVNMGDMEKVMIKNETAEEYHPEPEEENPDINLPDMSKIQLIEYAKEKGIQDITEKMTKDEIIERIQTHG